jgi:hypothetical protein
MSLERMICDILEMRKKFDSETMKERNVLEGSVDGLIMLKCRRFDGTNLDQNLVNIWVPRRTYYFSIIWTTNSF